MLGMIKLLNSVDRETVSQYKIAVRITDVANDALPDPIRQRSSTAQVTIHVLVRMHQSLCFFLSFKRQTCSQKMKIKESWEWLVESCKGDLSTE